MEAGWELGVDADAAVVAVAAVVVVIAAAVAAVAPVVADVAVVVAVAAVAVVDAGLQVEGLEWACQSPADSSYHSMPCAGEAVVGNDDVAGNPGYGAHEAHEAPEALEVPLSDRTATPEVQCRPRTA